MTATWTLQRLDFSGVTLCRKWFREILERCRCSNQGLLKEVVFGELVTNAVRHGRDPMWVDVSIDDRNLEIRVESAGECFELPNALVREPTDSGGRGMRIVAALADVVEVVPSPLPGCRVTARLPR